MSVREEFLLKKENMPVDSFEWGCLEWFARESLNGMEITLGLCNILPGMENPLHYHPNCDEVLYVIAGSIIHQLDGESIVMNAGDSLLIQKGKKHNAHNTGTAPAVCSIAFTTGKRETVHV